MLIISLIILLISVFSKKLNYIIRRINIFVLVINGFLFFLILDQISNSNVDLASKVSIYSNTLLMILLELSIFIFIVWIIGLILYKIIKMLSTDKKEEVTFSHQNLFDNTVTVDKKQETIKPEKEVEYIVIEKEIEKDDMFSLEEYKKMRELLELLNKKK